MQRLFDNLSKEFEGLDINVGRFVRYVETVVSSKLQDIKENRLVNSKLWGKDIFTVMAKGKKKAEDTFGNDKRMIDYATEHYIIDFFVGALSIIICLVEEGHIMAVEAAEILGLTILELNEIQILIHRQESTSDVLANFCSVVNDKQLINFGYLKAYTEIVMAGGMSCETAAEKLSIKQEELKEIIEKGVNVEDYI